MLRVVTNRIKSVVLAALAAAVLLVQPICDAHELGAGDPAECCVSIADAAPVDFANATPPAAKPSPAVPIAEVLPGVWRAAARNTAAAALPDHPLASLPYHVRSARILS